MITELPRTPSGEASEETQKNALAVFAHADDETLLAGALIPKLIDDGWRFHLLCVSPGDDDDRSARMELAAAELGIESVSSLRFAPAGEPASGVMASPPLLSAPEPAVAGLIEARIAALNPAMVLTHSPSGDYGHPDHARCHRVTVAAARAAAPNAAVYALAWPKSMLWLNSLAGRLLRSRGRAVQIKNELDLTKADEGSSPPSLPVTNTHDVHRFLHVRKRASRHYRKEMSQGPLPLRLLEAAPTWLQRPILGKARLSRAR